MVWRGGSLQVDALTYEISNIAYSQRVHRIVVMLHCQLNFLVCFDLTTISTIVHLISSLSCYMCVGATIVSFSSYLSIVGLLMNFLCFSLVKTRLRFS